jgi:hypothetical protein
MKIKILIIRENDIMRIRAMLSIEMDSNQFQTLIDTVDISDYNVDVKKEYDNVVITISDEDLDELMDTIGDILLDENMIRGSQYFKDLKEFYSELNYEYKWI